MSLQWLKHSCAHWSLLLTLYTVAMSSPVGEWLAHSIVDSDGRRCTIFVIIHHERSSTSVIPPCYFHQQGAFTVKSRVLMAVLELACLFCKLK